MKTNQTAIKSVKNHDRKLSFGANLVPRFGPLILIKRGALIKLSLPLRKIDSHN